VLVQLFCLLCADQNDLDQPARSCFSPQCVQHAADIRDILLFRSWVPQKDGQYAGAIVAVLLFGLLASGLRTLRGMWETRERIMRNQVRSSLCNGAWLLSERLQGFGARFHLSTFCCSMSSLEKDLVNSFYIAETSCEDLKWCMLNVGEKTHTHA
jgi:hypothetical protein